MTTGTVVVAIVVVIAFVLLRHRRDRMAASVTSEATHFPGTFEPLVTTIPDNGSIFTVGTTLHHKETGEKVEIVSSPELVDGEYAIRWSSGAIGHIHEAQLRNWFE